MIVKRLFIVFWSLMGYNILCVCVCIYDLVQSKTVTNLYHNSHEREKKRWI